MENLFFARIALCVISCTSATFLPPYPVGPHHHAMVHPPVLPHMWHTPLMTRPHMKPFFHPPMFSPMMKPPFKPFFKPNPFFMPMPYFKKMKPMLKPRIIVVQKGKYVKPPRRQIRPRVNIIRRPNNFRYARPAPRPMPRPTHRLPVPVFRRNVFTGYRPPPRTRRIDIPQTRVYRPRPRAQIPMITHRPPPAPVTIPAGSPHVPIGIPTRRDYSAQPVRRERLQTHRMRQWIQRAHGVEEDDDDNDDHDDDDDDDFDDYWEERLAEFDDEIEKRLENSNKNYYDKDDDDRLDDDFFKHSFNAQNLNMQRQPATATFVQQTNGGVGNNFVSQQQVSHAGNVANTQSGRRISTTQERGRNKSIAEIRSKYLENLAEMQSKYDNTRRNHLFSSGSNVQREKKYGET